jgi:TolB-like protein
MIIFNSAIEAVECAIQIQTELTKEPKIPLRIGIHTGDIVYDDEGVYGDGVNVASRIEGLAVSGAVLISGKVFDDVKNHRKISTTFLGTFDLKNVQSPMNVYAIANEGLTIPDELEIKARPADRKQSLAVLPFVNMSSDPENEYFSDGITEELLNVLAQEQGLQVTARTSSFAFKDRNRDIKQIGVQLGAKSILEGSVRKAGNRIRITAQLINAADGYHIWSETYDRQLEDIFAVQDEIAQKITNRLREKLTLEPEAKNAAKPHTSNMNAYKIYLKGLFHANKWTQEDAEIALSEFHKAIEMEPDFALAYTRLSTVHIYLGASAKKPMHQEYTRAREYALKAIQLDNRAGESHDALANIYLFHDWNWDEAFRSVDRAIELTPSYAGAHLTKSLLLAIHGKFDEAIDSMKISMQLDPFNAPGIFAYASVLLLADRIKECMDQLNKLFAISPDFTDALLVKGIVYELKGEFKKALDIYMAIPRVPEYEIMVDGYLGGLYKIMNQPAKSEAILDKLLESEKSSPHVKAPFSIAQIYAALGKTEKMFHFLNKSVKNRDNSVIYMMGNSPFKEYRSDPRFIKILQKIGLWK